MSYTTQTAEDKQLQEALINAGSIPSHIAIIMDGNGRWAKERGMNRVFGHHEGVKSVQDITGACHQLGVKYLTLYAFSTENWNRPQAEVQALMELLVKTLSAEIALLHKNNMKVRAIGDLSMLPPHVRKDFEAAMATTHQNTGLNFTLAISYGSRAEITNAVQQIAQQVSDGTLHATDINQALITQHLYTKDLPDPELVIRTANEYRVSNFLLWQIAYAEFFITPVLWPDFRRATLYEAIGSFQKRERKFGGILPQ